MAENGLKRGSVRWWLAVSLLAVLGLTFVGMGRWQLNRADERRAIGAQIERGRMTAPVQIRPGMKTSDANPWQSAQATGHWLPQYTVLLDNRAQDGRPGLWLAMPLALADDTVLLVLRGWVPRPIAGQGEIAKMELPDGFVTIRGEIAEHVPRLYELQEDGPLQFDGSERLVESEITLDLMNLPRRQNLSLDDLSNALPGQAVLPFVLTQTAEDDSILVDGRSLIRDWPQPSVDADKNMGYAMQWFMFASIAFGALVVLLWRTRRRATIAP
ncbi:SURF1 family protein [Orrella marina]|uniref:SURF1-like protein n=1 Tax=Orrella marina TaxID=2163011 RepID=A0A2R4XPX3_9BURK|nr:SURF1 family protein [Orrella marina]